MKAKLLHAKAKSILYNGRYYDTNKTIDLTISEAMRLGRTPWVRLEDAVYPVVPYNPDTWKNGKNYNLISNVDPFSGWGNATIGLIKYDNVDNPTLIGHINQVKDEKVLAAGMKDIDQSAAAVWHEQPKFEWHLSPFKKNICIVPFETTRIPPTWVARINSMDALFVPCEQNKQAFIDSGVTVPIEIIHWGVDETKFYPIDFLQDDLFTFGIMGSLSSRKGTDILIKAFTEEFKTEKDVRLICKTSEYGFNFAVHDQRIKIQQSPFTYEELLQDFYRKLDCFVFPTRGEGFGLPPLEAMAVGLPVIVTGWSGVMEYMKPEYGWILDYKLVPAKAFTEEVYKEECGDWAEPSIDDLKKKLRYAYEHKKECKQKGKAAAEYVKQNWLWKDKIKMYQQALDKHL